MSYAYATTYIVYSRPTLTTESLLLFSETIRARPIKFVDSVSYYVTYARQ